VVTTAWGRTITAGGLGGYRIKKQTQAVFCPGDVSFFSSRKKKILSFAAIDNRAWVAMLHAGKETRDEATTTTTPATTALYL
jgi:hypothetical protein